MLFYLQKIGFRLLIYSRLIKTKTQKRKLRREDGRSFPFKNMPVFHVFTVPGKTTFQNIPSGKVIWLMSCTFVSTSVLDGVGVVK